MSKTIIQGNELPKHFRGEDRPVKSKKATHLITYPNFLTSNDDHSIDRPFTICSPKRKKSIIQNNQKFPKKDYVPQFKVIGTKNPRKINIKEGHHCLSSMNPLKFDPLDIGIPEKSEIKRYPNRNKSNLSGSNAQPFQNEQYRASKRMYDGKYTDSSSMRISLSFAE